MSSVAYVSEPPPVRPMPPALLAGEQRAPEPSVQPADVVFRLALWVAVYATAAVAAVRAVNDPDVWFHLRAGQWMVAHGSVLSTDQFSSYAQGQPWPAYSWLFELLIYGSYQAFGLYGIILYRVVLTLGVVAAVHHLVARRERRCLVAVGVVGLAVAALVPLLNERPWLFTFLFTTWTLDAVLDLREGKGRWWVWLLPPMYALWANLHIQFVYGLFILFLACAAPFIDRLLRREAGGQAGAVPPPGWWKLVALSGCCLAATLLNPFTFRLYLVIFHYGAEPFAYQVVTELKALAFREPWDWAVLVLAGWAAFSLGGRPRLSAFEVLLLAAAAYLGFRARRDAWFVVLAAAAVLAGACRRAPRPEECFALTWPRKGVVAAAVVLALLAAALGRGLSRGHLDAAVADEFPAAAATAVEEGGFAGPLYNHFDWGNYLVWRLPGLPVAIDGRTNLYGDQRMLRFERTWRGCPGWDTDPDLAAAGVVIAQAQIPLAALLRLDRRFELVHEDRVAVVFVRRKGVP